MEARDNGKGETVVKKGMGLAGMEERTGAAGGKLIIDGSDGFSVITLLPVENDMGKRAGWPERQKPGVHRPGESRLISHAADNC